MVNKVIKNDLLSPDVKQKTKPIKSFKKRVSPPPDESEGTDSDKDQIKGEEPDPGDSSVIQHLFD